MILGTMLFQAGCGSPLCCAAGPSMEIQESSCLLLGLLTLFMPNLGCVQLVIDTMGY